MWEIPVLVRPASSLLHVLTSLLPFTRTLNGMETRHPHDVYTLLLENLDVEESRCNAKTAARKLEKYFCSRSGEDTEPEEVYVVLVDEIDYLVTSTQEVLYDLFNWPIRSVESGSKRRLVVIGVSNLSLIHI